MALVFQWDMAGAWWRNGGHQRKKGGIWATVTAVRGAQAIRDPVENFAGCPRVSAESVRFALPHGG